MFLLFVDLVKAFDRVIRQLVVGLWRVANNAKIPLLISLGVDLESAEWIARCIDERGDVFQQWNINATAQALAYSLHAGAWFRVRGGERFIESKTGGRQGCCIGAIIFNSAYAIALDMSQ